MHKQKRYDQRSQHNFMDAVKGYRRLFLILPLMVVLHLASATGARAQTIIQGWTFAAESSNHVDVSYSIVKCSPTSDAELHLQIFNEKAATDNAKFNVVIADAALGQSFTTLVNRPLGVAELVSADCATTTPSNLRIAVPAAYDPAALTVTITFIP